MSILVASKVCRYFRSLVFGESLKLENVWDHNVSMFGYIF